MQIIMTGRPYSGIDQIETQIKTMGLSIDNVKNINETQTDASPDIVIAEDIDTALQYMTNNESVGFILAYIYAEPESRIARAKKDGHNATSDFDKRFDEFEREIENLVELSTITIPDNCLGIRFIQTDTNDYSPKLFGELIINRLIQHDMITNILKGAVAEGWIETSNDNILITDQNGKTYERTVDHMATNLLINDGNFAEFMRNYITQAAVYCPDIHDAIRLWDCENNAQP